MKLAIVSGFAAVLAAASAHSQTLTLHTIDNPVGTGGAAYSGTGLSGINNAGEIVGNASGASSAQAFTAIAPYSAFRSVAVPNASSTSVTGVNPVGDLCGTYTIQGLGYPTLFAFIRSVKGGKYQYTTVRGGEEYTELSGIGGQAVAVGRTYASTSQGGFAISYDQVTGKVTDLTVPGQSSPAIEGVTRSGLSVGSGVNATNNRQVGLIWQLGSTKPPTTYLVPGANYTFFSGLNQRGDVVGFYSAGGPTIGLIYHISDGSYQSVSASQYGTVLTSINDNGQAVGYYFDAQNIEHGLLVSGIAP